MATERSCAAVRERLEQALLSRSEIGPEERAHLAECAACAAIHARLQDLAAELDAAIAEVLDPDHGADDPPSYTGSVDACIELVHHVLPGWGWHVGYGPKGILPYAALTHDDARHEASAPTVPLALLLALLEAAISERRRRRS